MNGKVERSFRIDSEEVLPAAGEPGHRRRQSLQQQLQEWEDSYNYHRPHGVLAGQTPCERLRQKAQDPLS
ncbi:integrase core domain-containing protein [Streptomyces nigra]|uniref:integrase core domain-containing protein n=1 Tax=Streptomyces nigra TaxID=1827580 RepID=UPI003452E5F0